MFLFFLVAKRHSGGEHEAIEREVCCVARCIAFKTITHYTYLLLSSCCLVIVIFVLQLSATVYNIYF